MGTTREGWYERDELKKVTLDWVKSNVKLTKREEELLPIIYDRKLVRRDHLEIISPSYRNEESRTSLLNRAIKKLFKKSVLDKIHEEQDWGKGSKPSIVAIDKAGAMILGKPFKRRIIHKNKSLKDGERPIRRLPSNFRHINGVNQIEVETILFCEQYGYEIILWELEHPKSFKYNNTEILLIPDVIMLLKVNESYMACFIEYDTGSEGIREREPKIIEEKLIKYKRYKSSLLWESEEWQKYFKGKVFPILLFVTEDQKRISFVNDKGKELGIQTLALYYKNYSSVLSKLVEIMKKNSPTN